MLISKLSHLKPIATLQPLLSFYFAKSDIPRRFQNRQPKRPPVVTKEDKQIIYNPLQAMQLMRLHTWTTFEESVEICIRLNVNPKNGDQIVRATANLPAGLGKEIKTAVFCTNDQWEELMEKNVRVDMHIKESDLKQLEKGVVPFEKLFSTPSNIPKMKHLGKQLGPKGLMPNSKLGTLVPVHDLPNALEQAKSGQVSFRVDQGRNIHAHIGKMSFTDEQLMINWQAVMKTLVEKRPSSTKGKYFTHAYLKSTMGVGWRINLMDIDPRTDKSMWSCLRDDTVVNEAVSKGL